MVKTGVKTLAIILFFVVLFSTSVTSLTTTAGTRGGTSPTAQISEQKNQSDTKVFIQILLRDSEGHLIGYSEGYPQIFYLDEVISWVEPRAQKSTIIKEGESREILQFEDGLSWSYAQTMGAYFLKLPAGGTADATALYYYHDSFHVQPGDRGQVFWTIIR